jgi:hypothetical protein
LSGLWAKFLVSFVAGIIDRGGGLTPVTAYVEFPCVKVVAYGQYVVYAVTVFVVR